MLKSVTQLQRRQLHGGADSGDPTPLMFAQLGDALRRHEDDSAGLPNRQ
jgi:hypothetical protein